MKSTLKKIFLYLLVLTVIFANCTAPFRVRKPLPKISPDLLIYKIRQHASRLKTFQGRARLTFVSPKGSFGGSLRISVKTPDSLWIKVEGPLGIDLLTGSLGGGEAIFYNPWENIVYKGSIKEIQKSGILPFDMDLSNFMHGIIGLLVPDEKVLDSIDHFSTRKDKYILNIDNNEEMWIEPKGPVISYWEVKNTKGKILWRWEGKDFKEEKGVRLPRIIKMTHYQSRKRLTLFYEAIKTNQSMKSGWSNIRIPEGVDTIEL